MNEKFFDAMKTSYTAYHASDNAVKILTDGGFEQLFEDKPFNVYAGGKYFIRRGSTAVIAFKIGELDDYNFKIVASHIDSPALKLKYNAVSDCMGMSKLNVETYGGAINSTFTDVPLKIAGKVYLRKGNEIYGRTYTDAHNYIIPNVAIHMNRKANDGFIYNPQVDLCPLFGLGADKNYFDNIGAKDETVVGYDLFAVNATEPFVSGANDEFYCSPRLDNQVCAFSSIFSLMESDVHGVAVAFLADNEEIGSRTAEGADSDFLKKTLKAINKSLGFDRTAFDVAIAKSFLVSADNAHAVHPNHPELSDPTNKVMMGDGIVIKHHANKNYTTDGLSSALFKQLMKNENIKTQHFFMRSDLRCGSTLGTLSTAQIAIKSVDIGLAQLAMHSSLETMCLADADELEKGLKAFYGATYTATENGFEL